MLAAVRWSAVLLGVGVGTLALAVVALVLWLVLSILNVEGSVGAATTFGTVAGLAVAGWWAGRRAPLSAWFHGALAAMGIALLVVVTAVGGGSPAPTSQVLLLAAMAVAVGGTTGHLAGRRSPRAG